MEAAPHKLTRPVLGGLALLVLLYGGAHLFWYWGTPLGQSAVLDERENLQLAAQITTGTLPPEPFYRAMGYPLFLAGLRATGLLTNDAPQAATAAGLLLHVLTTMLLARLAQRWFASGRAGLVAGLLHGLNPVLIHEATQVLDGALANTFFIVGLLCLPAPGEQSSRRNALWLSLTWTAAALVRPQFLLVWLALPLLWIAASGPLRQWRAQLRPLLTAMAAGGLLWLAQGAWSWRISGEFRVLPWQGTYNLWAANKPGASGRYYAQMKLREGTAPAVQENPARADSITLYREATGDLGPLRIDALNRYWHRRLLDETRAHPAAWLKLQTRKAAYLANNAEQYNNKTYSFHQARSPWLRPNPLGWGLLLLTGALGLIALDRRHRPLCGAVLATGGVVAAGILLAYASGRFRLPLAALLCALAGGAVAGPREWWPENFRGRLAIAALLLGLGAVTFPGWFGATDKSTYVQDHLLLATAAERTGDDRITWDEARAALAMQPGHPHALSLGLTSYFNLLLTGTPSSHADETAWHDLARQLLARSAAPARDQHANLIALALWRAHVPAGENLWRQRLSARDDPEALAALCLAGSSSADELSRLIALPIPTEPSSFLLLAKSRLAPGQLADWARGRRSEVWLTALSRAAENIFPAGR